MNPYDDETCCDVDVFPITDLGCCCIAGSCEVEPSNDYWPDYKPTKHRYKNEQTSHKRQ